MTRNSVVVTGIAAGLLTTVIYSAPARADSSPAAACTALAKGDFSKVQDAPTQIMDADMASTASDVPAHCHVQGYVMPQVGFELKLPTSNWNGKFVEVGTGGYGGSTRFGFLIAWCNVMLEKGYACIVSDLGHATSRTGLGNGQTDMLWAYNNLQAEFDWGIRAAHVAALAGKAITERFYGSAPKFSYFIGSSGGGRQGLMQAQRFAWDFDGIVVIDPGNVMGTGMAMLWNGLVMNDRNGKPLFTAAEIDMLHESVLAKCDADDGLRDRIIGDPRVCKFDPSELVCKRGKTSDCLTDAQAQAVSKVYGGPRTSTGERVFYGAMPGSEKGIIYTAPQSVLSFKEAWWRYGGFVPDPGPDWHATDFDFDADPRRLGMMEALYVPDNPDLRKFKAAGGKLIISQGWDDSGSPLPLNSLDYYEMVERVMGGPEKTKDFARLFMIPGKAHGPGGPGADSIDYMSYIEAWVEQGRAPDMMVGAHLQHEHPEDSSTWGDYVALPKDANRIKFTRPHYPYPLQARYKGAGDPSDHRNFAPVQPAPGGRTPKAGAPSIE